MALLLEDEESKITIYQVNGILSPFYLSDFFEMELSSPFFINNCINFVV